MGAPHSRIVGPSLHHSTREDKHTPPQSQTRRPHPNPHLLLIVAKQAAHLLGGGLRGGGLGRGGGEVVVVIAAKERVDDGLGLSLRLCVSVLVLGASGDGWLGGSALAWRVSRRTRLSEGWSLNSGETLAQAR